MAPVSLMNPLSGLSAIFALGLHPEASKSPLWLRRPLAHSNQNAGRNTYIWMDVAWTRAEAARAHAMPRGNGAPFGDGRPALWGMPISVKDLSTSPARPPRAVFTSIAI
jgi:hypothetical protein